MKKKMDDGLTNEERAERELLLQNEELILKTAAIAYENALIREMEEIANDPDAPDMSPEAAERLHNSVMKMLEDKRKQAVRLRFLKRMMQVVVCFAVILGVGLFVAFQVDASRSYITNFFLNSFPEYSEVKYDAQANALPPVGWESPYYPLWLPEGTKVTKVTFEDKGQFIWYQDQYEHEFFFAVLPQTSEIFLFDRDEMIPKNIKISDKDAVFACNDDGSIQTIMFITSQNVLTIKGSLSESDIIKIAENLSKYD